MFVDVNIEEKICTGCGACVDSCPTDVIRMHASKARVTYPEDCQGCFLCEFDCPVDAIMVFPRKYTNEEREALWTRLERTCKFDAQI